LINCAIFALAANPDPAEEAMALQMKPSAQWRSGTGQASHCGRVCVCVCSTQVMYSCTVPPRWRNEGNTRYKMDISGTAPCYLWSVERSLLALNHLSWQLLNTVN